MGIRKLMKYLWQLTVAGSIKVKSKKLTLESCKMGMEIVKSQGILKWRISGIPAFYLTDIDECVYGVCHHGHCINTLGGFVCTCDHGYDGHFCNESKFFFYC